MVVRIARDLNKRKNLNKVQNEKSNMRGERIYMDDSSKKMKSGGGSKTLVNLCGRSNRFNTEYFHTN